MPSALRQFTKKLLTPRPLAAAALIVFGVSVRLLIHGQNVEPLTVASLLAGSVLAGRYAVIVPLIMVALTDAIIGNSSILLFTWSGWLGVGALGWLLRRRPKYIFRHSLELTGMGLASTLWFYLWTNFGVWLIDNLYPHTVAGLLTSYINGIPFLRPQLFGNLIFVPAVSLIFLAIWQLVAQRSARTVAAVRFPQTPSA